MKKRLIITSMLALLACLALALPGFAQEVTVPMDYGRILLTDGYWEGRTLCQGENIPVYAMAPGAYLYKYGITESTTVTVYKAEMDNGILVPGEVRFHRGAEYFEDVGFGPETSWQYW